MGLIVVGATVAGWKCDGTESKWLTHAGHLIADATIAGHDLRFMLALELDGRRERPFASLLTRLSGLPHDVWSFTLDDHITEFTTSNRLRHICTGRNVVTEYAESVGASHLLYLDTDLEPDPHTIKKLLEMDVPIAGGDVPSYCLHGEPRPEFPYPVEEYEFNTAGYLLVRREVFSRLRWRSEGNGVVTDDPCWAHDARAIGYPTLVRRDCVGLHESLVGVEVRDVDRGYYR